MTTKIRMLLILALAAAAFFIASDDRNESNDQVFHEIFRNFNRATAVIIPESLEFAGEKVPLDQVSIYEALEREFLANTYWHSNTLLTLKRTARFFPTIEPILARNGIPADFKYLAVAESGLTNVVSPAGAAGFWQFLDRTAKEYGLEVNADVDERYHLAKATEAACRYLRKSYAKYGSWYLAAAAFNAGNDRIDRALADQKADNYFDLYLIEETARYVHRLLAIKVIFESPSTYGFYLRSKDYYTRIPTHEVTIDSAVNSLPMLAKSMGLSYKTLRDFNPWIRSYKLPNPNRKPYQFAIPEKKYLLRSNLMRWSASPNGKDTIQ